MEMGLRKRQRGSDAFIVFRFLAWTLVDVQPNGGISDVHAQWFSTGRSEQILVMS